MGRYRFACAGTRLPSAGLKRFTTSSLRPLREVMSIGGRAFDSRIAKIGDCWYSAVNRFTLTMLPNTISAYRDDLYPYVRNRSEYRSEEISRRRPAKSDPRKYCSREPTPPSRSPLITVRPTLTPPA